MRGPPEEPSGQGFKPDPRQPEVIVDADGLDGAQVSDAVLVHQQVAVVDGHLKVIVGAKNLYLQEENISLLLSATLARRLTSKGCPWTKGKCSSCLSSAPHLLPMKLFLTITFLPPSLKRGFRWNATSERSVVMSTVTLTTPGHQGQCSTQGDMGQEGQGDRMDMSTDLSALSLMVPVMVMSSLSKTP